MLDSASGSRRAGLGILNLLSSTHDESSVPSPPPRNQRAVCKRYQQLVWLRVCGVGGCTCWMCDHPGSGTIDHTEGALL